MASTTATGSVRSTRHRTVSGLSSFALVVAPPLWLVGWIIMRLGGRLGPNPGWQSAHSLWILAFALFGVVAVALHRMLTGDGRGRCWRIASTLAAVTTVVGAVAMVGQMSIDLWSSLGVADKAGMNLRYDQVYDALPWADTVLFTLAPIVLYAGLLAQVAILAGARVTGYLPLVLVTLGEAGSIVGRQVPAIRFVEGLGMVAIFFALFPLTRRRAGDPRSSTVVTPAGASGGRQTDA